MLATRGEFMAALRRELPEAVRLLQSGNIAPVDMAQSAIGPGIKVFSRYARVVEADGSSMPVSAALAIINDVLGEVLDGGEAELDADTRFALTWFSQHGYAPGPAGDADSVARAKNHSLSGIEDSGIGEARAGKFRLYERSELAPGWSPVEDPRRTVWEATQYLVAALERSETEAAELLHVLGGYSDRARQLAYLLYQKANDRGWAAEAGAYNTLITDAQQRARPPVRRPGAHRAVDQLQDLLLGLRGHPSGPRTAQTQPTFPRSTASSMAWALTASLNRSTSQRARSSSQLRSLAGRPRRAANAASAASFTARRMPMTVDTSTCCLRAASAWSSPARSPPRKSPTSSPATAHAAADELRSRSLTTPLRSPQEPARVGSFLSTISASNSDAEQFGCLLSADSGGSLAFNRGPSRSSLRPQTRRARLPRRRRRPCRGCRRRERGAAGRRCVRRLVVSARGGRPASPPGAEPG